MLIENLRQNISNDGACLREHLEEGRRLIKIPINGLSEDDFETMDVLHGQLEVRFSCENIERRRKMCERGYFSCFRRLWRGELYFYWATISECNRSVDHGKFFIKYS